MVSNPVSAANPHTRTQLSDGWINTMKLVIVYPRKLREIIAQNMQSKGCIYFTWHSSAVSFPRHTSMKLLPLLLLVIISTRREWIASKWIIVLYNSKQDLLDATDESTKYKGMYRFHMFHQCIFCIYTLQNSKNARNLCSGKLWAKACMQEVDICQYYHYQSSDWLENHPWCPLWPLGFGNRLVSPSFDLPCLTCRHPCWTWDSGCLDDHTMHSHDVLLWKSICFCRLKVGKRLLQQRWNIPITITEAFPSNEYELTHTLYTSGEPTHYTLPAI